MVELEKQIAAIRDRLGRPLRVLHVGNIANNAYNNARIQRQYGIEADVLCHDYYHIMGCPEWEDAAFTGDVDPMAPDWWSTSLGGWKRPDWFVQGPTAACLQYLRARHIGDAGLTSLLWSALEARSFEWTRASQPSGSACQVAMSAQLADAVGRVEQLGLAEGPAFAMSATAKETIRALVGVAFVDRPVVGRASVSRMAAEARDVARAAYSAGLQRFVRPGLEKDGRLNVVAALWLKCQQALRPKATRDDLIVSLRENDDGGRQLRRMMVGRRHQLASMRHAASRNLGVAGRPSREAQLIATHAARFDTSALDARFVAYVKDNIDALRALPPKEKATFITYYTSFAPQFFDVLQSYDVVQGYSIDGGLCVANGVDRYAAYEHGTLRDLPFQDDFLGAATRMAYHNATRVFVTNSDVMPSVARMALVPERVVRLPHAFDDRKLLKFRADHPNLQPPSGPPIIFSPTRQHWHDKSGSWTKGNDVLLRAAAVMAREGHDFRLHLVAWGKELPLSKALIDELGIADKVVWVPTMQKRELWAAYCCAHAVADQFVLPALGGVGFETMVLGRRLITAIDERQLADFFGAAPPCLAASTVDACAAQLRRVIADPGDAAGVGAAAVAWMQDRHSARRIVALQMEAYQALLDTPRQRDARRLDAVGARH